MKHLSRFDIEAIADKYVQAYMALPDVRNTQIYRIDPELLLEKVLGLNVEYQHLSYDGSILGMTSFTEMGVQVFEDDDNEAFFFLDGKTVLVEKDLNFDSKLKGRKQRVSDGATLIWTKELSMLITRWYIMTIEPTVVSVAVILISIPRKLRLENAKFRCWISSKKHSLWKRKDRSCLIFIVKLLWTDILILSFLTVLDSRNIRQPLTKQSVVSSVTAMMNSF